MRRRLRDRRSKRATSFHIKHLLFLVILFIATVITVSFIQQQQLLKQHAQTVPSPACLGNCPTGTVPSAAQTLTDPTATPVADRQPVPCPTSTVNSNVYTAHNYGHWHKHRHSDGVSSGLITFLLELLLKLLELLGLGDIHQPVTSPPVKPTATPIVAAPSAEPDTTDTDSPAPSNPCDPGASVGTNPTTAPQPSRSDITSAPTGNGTVQTAGCSQADIQKLVASVSQANIEANLRALVQDDTKPAPNQTVSRHVSSSQNPVKVNYAKQKLTSYGLQIIDQPLNADGQSLNNVVGRVNGTDQSSIYALGGHIDTMNNYDNNYDPKQPAPGGDDDGSGVVTMMEVARVMKSFEKCMKSSVDFIGFNDEEESGNGSPTYVKSVSGKTIKGAINMDMVGYAPNGECVKSDIKEAARDQALAQKVVDMNTKYNVGLNITTGTYTQNSGDDLAAFWDANHPGAYMIECATEVDPKSYPYYHTLNDKIENVNFSQLAKLAKVLVATLAELSMQ